MAARVSHKIAMRTEGRMVNCYWVPIDASDLTFDREDLVASVTLDAVQSAPELGEAFTVFIQALSIELLHLRCGIARERVVDVVTRQLPGGNA